MNDMKNIDQAKGNSTNLSMQSEGLPDVSTFSNQDLPNISEFKDFGIKKLAKTKSENDLREYTGELMKNYESNYKPDIRNITSDTTDSIEAETFPNIVINPEIINNSELVTFPYEDLVRITKNFAENLVSLEDPPHNKAGKIGSGGFADVYVGYYPNYGHIAVKKPKPNRIYRKTPKIFNKIFNSEIQFLSLFKHTNIVDIIGYSTDGPSPCIVCEYIEGGTLEKKLEDRVLNEKPRINIMIGVAEALKYLHSDKTANMTKSMLVETGSKSQKNFVHGDVKTANILLTKDYVPKLCDFAAGKQYDVTRLVSELMLTLSYLAPEQVVGTVTQETDIYHYGRILLELLTGLKSIVQTQSGDINLKTYLEENCQNNEIENFLDRTVGTWTKATEIYSLAQSCLQDRKLRPSAAEICRTLNNMV